VLPSRRAARETLRSEITVDKTLTKWRSMFVKEEFIVIRHTICKPCACKHAP